MSNTPREDVIKLAREAGFIPGPSLFIVMLERFYQLATAKAAAEEREACAKVAQDYSCQVGDAPWECAAAIRARSNT